MKTPLLLTVVAGLVFAGCGDSSNKPAQTTNTSTSGGTLTAPVDYLAGAAKAQQSAVKTVDVTSLSKAIDMFNVQEGRFPKDLNELVAKKYIPQIPEAPAGSKIVYDGTAGTVKVVKQ